MRFCPVCGQSAAERFCPADGTVTVVRKALRSADLDYAEGSVVEGRYRLGKRLGHGGFGAVYAATHTGTGKQVALKALNVEFSADNSAIVRRFWQEAQITSRLRHPNTVRVFDVGQTELGAFYLTMELLTGQTLQQVCDHTGRMGERAAAHLGIEILKSLQEAHGVGLVHRDLKPANIMLGQGDDPGAPLVKVLDFGIARTADSSLTKTGAALGTPAYMSPEQCRGLAVDARSDLYAVAAVMFHCVAGRPPFVDENPLTVMFQHADAPPPDLRTLTPELLSADFLAVVAKALAKDPDQRFADAKSMREALESPLSAAVQPDAPTRIAWVAQPAPPAAEPTPPASPGAPAAAFGASADAAAARAQPVGRYSPLALGLGLIGMACAGAAGMYVFTQGPQMAVQVAAPVSQGQDWAAQPDATSATTSADSDDRAEMGAVVPSPPAALSPTSLAVPLEPPPRAADAERPTTASKASATGGSPTSKGAAKAKPAVAPLAGGDEKRPDSPIPERKAPVADKPVALD